MIKDAVCQEAAAKSEYHGQTYHFCSKNCKQRFDRDPQRYLGRQTTKR